jgi:hypothetical protein
MDLLKLTKRAVENPLHVNNFFVLFVTSFIILIIGLTLISFFGMVLPGRGASNCDTQSSKKVAGKISTSTNEVFQLDFKGNTSCLISARFDWKDSKNVAKIWVYDPEGRIEVIEPILNQTTAHYTAISPVKPGVWRLVVKGSTET